MHRWQICSEPTFDTRIIAIPDFDSGYVKNTSEIRDINRKVQINQEIARQKISESLRDPAMHLLSLFSACIVHLKASCEPIFEQRLPHPQAIDLAQLDAARFPANTLYTEWDTSFCF